MDSAGLGLASVLATVVYAPAKIVYAAAGTLVGGGTYVVSGGDAELANAVIGPAVRGDYIVTPDRLRHPETLEFMGGRHPATRRVDHQVRRDALPEVAAARPSTCKGLGAYPNVYFESGLAGLDATAQQSLDQAVSTLLDCPLATAEIRAFSDALGSRDANFELSRRRAESVRDYLVNRGVPEDRIRSITFGEDNPVAANATKAGRAENRRVEVVLR